MAEIEGLDLGLDVVGQHFASQPIHQIGRILVDAGWKVVGPDGQRCHVGPQRQHAAAFQSSPGPAAGGELDDHARAMLFQPFLQPGEPVGVGRRRPIVEPDMAMGDRGPRLEGLVRRFDLLRIVIGTAGLSALLGTDPVIATQMMQGFVMGRS